MTTLEIIGLTYITMLTFSGLAALPFLVWDWWDKRKGK